MNNRVPERLFRQQAIEALSAPDHGRPAATMPRPWLWLAGLSLLAVMATSYFVCTTQYARKETVRGWLVSEQGVVRMTHGVAARVTSVVRQIGDTVRRGDAIAYLSREEISGDGSAFVQQLTELLHAELDEVDARAAIARQQLAADRESLASQVAGVAAELHALQLQEREQSARVARSAMQVERLEAARARGAIAEVDVLRQQDELAAMRQSLARLGQERGRLERERRGLVARQARLKPDFEVRISELGSLRNDLRRRIAQTENLRLQPLESPIDGRIATIDLIEGSTIRPQQLLVSITPEPSSLVADVYVPSRAVGLIETGQLVKLRYEAFPHEQFGMATGRVESIDDFVLMPGDLPPTFAIREASYRIRVRPEEDHVTDQGLRYRLKPGMLLVAEIVLESRSLVSWMLARFDMRV